MSEPPPPFVSPNLMTVKQACLFLNCSRASLYRMMKRKGFPSRRIKGLGRRVVRDQLEIYLITKGATP